MNNKFQISNFGRIRLLRRSLRSWSRNDNGFTLVEVLVVSGIFVILSTIIVSILAIVLRGAKKSDSMVIVRQNGEQAMAQMVRILRFAKSVDYPATCDGVTSQDHITISLAVDSSTTTFSCPGYNGSTGIKSEGTVAISLTNLQTVSVITSHPLPSCSFVCTQQAGGSPRIDISFTLSKVNSSGAPEGDAVIPFHSSVTLRNISDQ